MCTKIPIGVINVIIMVVATYSKHLFTLENSETSRKMDERYGSFIRNNFNLFAIINC